MKRIILISVAALLVASAASAMKLQDVIELANSGLGDEVIMSQIEASDEVFTLTVQDILDLKKAGVSDRVITFMINTGKNRIGNEAYEDAAEEDVDDGDEYDRYHSGVDDRYRGYSDPYWNVYLSWGYSRYYDPFHYIYWPSYSYYYSPSRWCGSYGYASYYYRNNRHHYWPNNGNSYRAASRHRSYKDGRHIGNRGGYRRDLDRDRSTRKPAGTTRTYKGRTIGERGGSKVKPPTRQDKTRVKPPGKSRRAAPSRDTKINKPPSRSGRAAPAPSTRGGNGGPTKTSGRTIKKS